jgi:hypothetical protein
MSLEREILYMMAWYLEDPWMRKNLIDGIKSWEITCGIWYMIFLSIDDPWWLHSKNLMDNIKFCSAAIYSKFFILNVSRSARGHLSSFRVRAWFFCLKTWISYIFFDRCGLHFYHLKKLIKNIGSILTRKFC